MHQRRKSVVYCAMVWASLFYHSPSIAGLLDWDGPSSYEDCILANLKGSESNVAVEAVKNACRKKFPPSFDFDAITVPGGVETLGGKWGEIAASPWYHVFSPNEKADARNYFFDRYVASSFNQDFVDEARWKFHRFVESRNVNIDNSLVIQASQTLWQSLLVACQREDYERVYALFSERKRMRKNLAKARGEIVDLCRREDAMGSVVDSVSVTLNDGMLCVTPTKPITDLGTEPVCGRVTIEKGELRLEN